MFHSYGARPRSFGSHGGNRQRQPFNPRRSRGVYIPPTRYVQAARPVEQEAPYETKHDFVDFGLDDLLMTNITRHGYSVPTPIQDQAIPVLMDGKDVVGIANTGTGKTAAFLLPMIHKVLQDSSQGVLILAPTRELAIQVFEELKSFVHGLPIGITPCIGGMNLNGQISRLKSDPHFVVGTPGRIKDLIQRRAFDPAKFSNIILDEVDRMLDIGFRKDILFLIAQLPEQRHAGFFSATMNQDTEEIMHRLMSNPVTISVKKQETIASVEQDVIKLQPGQNKIEVLYQLLVQEEFEKVIVFGRTKHGINRLERELYRRGITVTSIHGNKSQNARQRSLRDFKNNRVQTLLATDVASRGIDIDGVTHVINFDEPMTYDDYVHRIGRTGRAGKTGKALTFVL